MNADYKPKEIPEDLLRKMSTERLLRIFRKVRRQAIAVWNIGICDCCGERVYCLPGEEERVLASHEVWVNYRNRIKAILDTRENVSKPYHWKKTLNTEIARKKNSKKTSSGKIRNQSDNEWKDFEADG